MIYVKIKGFKVKILFPILLNNKIQILAYILRIANYFVATLKIYFLRKEIGKQKNCGGQI